MVPEQEFPHTPDGSEMEPVNLESTPEVTSETPPPVANLEPSAPETVAESTEMPVDEAQSPVDAPVDTPVAEAEPASAEVPVAEAPVAEEVAVEAPAVAEAPQTEAPAVVHIEAPEAAEDEVPAVTAEGDVAEEEEYPHVDYTEDKGENAANSLLQEILGDEENLDSVVEKANPQELCLLMESIATRGDVAEFVSKIANIKKSFDSKIDPETVETALVSRFNTALARFNKKRMVYYAEREKEKEENSNKKKELLDRLKAIVTEEQVTKLSEVREIQNQWREVGWVMQKDVQPFNETYRHFLDIFYNLRSQYQELLDYDRKFNLDEKKKIIDEIEKLIPEDETTTREEWNVRSERVKQVQEFWRTMGHVPREEQEAVNAAFRDVLDRFYEMRSGYYELQDQQKGENAEKKAAILEKLKAYHDFAGPRPKEWNDVTKEILELQEQWKNIGPGPTEQNKELWKEYRAECDQFFARKQEFFKSFDDERGENLIKKTAICEKAEAVMNSEDYRETTEILKQLQEEWKNTGPVHDRYSNKIWKRFRTACDAFFERKTTAQSASKSEFDENLKIKLDLISQVEAIVASADPSVHAEEFEAIQLKWKETGHVPFKQKDKINGAYRDALAIYFDKTRQRGGAGGGDRRGGGGFGGGGGGGERRGGAGGGGERRGGAGGGGDRRGGSSGGGGGYNQGGGGAQGGQDRRGSTGDPVEDEMRRMRIKIQVIQEKVDSYETNILYISKGKSGDSLRAQIQGQIDHEKAEIEKIKRKIKEMKAAKEAPVVEAAVETQVEAAAEHVDAPVAEHVAEAPEADHHEEAPAAESNDGGEGGGE